MARPRFYLRIAKDITNDMKMARLTDGERWCWIVLLIAADNSSEPGVVRATPEELAYAGRVDPENMRGCLEKLTAGERPPVVRDEDGAYRIVHWYDHQGPRNPSDDPEAVNERVRRFRARQPGNGGNGGNGVSSRNDVSSRVTAETTHAMTSHPSQVVENEVFHASDVGTAASGPPPLPDEDFLFPACTSVPDALRVARSTKFRSWAAATYPEVNLRAEIDTWTRRRRAAHRQGETCADYLADLQDWVARKAGFIERDRLTAGAVAREQARSGGRVGIPEHGCWILPPSVAPPRPPNYPADAVPTVRDGLVQWFPPGKVPSHYRPLEV